MNSVENALDKFSTGLVSQLQGGTWEDRVCWSAMSGGTTPRMPDLAVQRAAMEKLGFLAGSWAGEAQVFAGGGGALTLGWSEEAQFKLDGLLLTIEAKGVSRTDGKVVRRALGLVAYDDFESAYRMRAFNDGRYLETELKLLDGEHGLGWGFEVGEFRTNSVLRINEKGEWTEVHHLTVGSQPARKMMEVRVGRSG